jgi:hypothetical protein
VSATAFGSEVVAAETLVVGRVGAASSLPSQPATANKTATIAKHQRRMLMTIQPFGHNRTSAERRSSAPAV